MEMPSAIKNNPIKSVIGFLGFMISFVTLLLLVDDRYAHAADISQVQQEIANVQRTSKDQINQLRSKQLMDEIFKLEFKESNGEATPLDKALKKRYEQELKSLQTGNQ